MAAVADVWSRKVVGWSMGPRMAAELADDAPRMAISAGRPGPGCIHHSDSENVISRFCGNRNGAVSCKPGPRRSILARTPIDWSASVA